MYLLCVCVLNVGRRLTTERRTEGRAFSSTELVAELSAYSNNNKMSDCEQVGAAALTQDDDDESIV